MSEKNIVVAGSSGYIGKAIIPKLLEKFPESKIYALSRSKLDMSDPRIIWKSCDLFSLKSVQDALPKEADLALYFVHSMGPTAQLDQGSFADYDIILADNFAKAIKNLKIKHLIYLSGLIPDVDKLSLHLQSRLEVENIFSGYSIPLTVFRAGLIIGDGISSFKILLKLVNRLPMMICPEWTQTLTSPVALKNVLNSITSCALEEEHINKVYDIVGCKPLTYIEMMKATAKKIGKKRYFFTVPFFTPTLSRLWVSLITQTPKNLIYPLIESLKDPMLGREDHIFDKKLMQQNYADLLNDVDLKKEISKTHFKYRPQRKTVRSVQRLSLPQGKDAQWIKSVYLEWLPKFLFPFIRVFSETDTVQFCIFSKRFVLLELKVSRQRSHADRQLLYIIKGLLVSEQKKGRLEFRVVLDRKYVICAIHDYKPTLPWFIYKYTQAKAHLFVMNAFRKKILSEVKLNDA